MYRLAANTAAPGTSELPSFFFFKNLFCRFFARRSVLLLNRSAYSFELVCVCGQLLSKLFQRRRFLSLLPCLTCVSMAQARRSTMGMRSGCLLSLIIITFILGGALLGLSAYQYRPARDFWDAGNQNPSTLDLWFYAVVVSLVAGCAVVLAAILGFVVSLLPSLSLNHAHNLASTIVSRITSTGSGSLSLPLPWPEWVWRPLDACSWH